MKIDRPAFGEVPDAQPTTPQEHLATRSASASVNDELAVTE
jgi:hypothetical protein